MDLAGMQWFLDPAVALFLALTIISVFGRFFREWILSCLICSVAGSLVVILFITAGQLAGQEPVIRYYITSRYLFLGTLDLALRDILLSGILTLSFLIAMAAHVLKVEQALQKRIHWIPRRASCQYEMEHTLRIHARDLHEPDRK